MARDCEIECVLEPGSYIVVPRTTGCSIKRPLDAEEENIKLFETDGTPNSLFSSTINDIFKKFDLIMSNTMNYKEFAGLCNTIGKRISE